MKRIALLVAAAALALSAPALAQQPKPPAPAAKPAKPAPAKPAEPAKPAGPVSFGAPEPLTIVSGAKTSTFQVELADTPAKAAQGLSGRTELAKDHGMLFDFRAAPQEAGVTMKGVTLPLDVVFLEPDGKVSATVEAAKPGSWRKITPGFPVAFAVEIPAGQVKELGIKAGDKVQHKLIHAPTTNG